ncbi:MAG TPA: cyclic nucleotide-binding domain-containing protein [Tepidiformaceae bacterium]|jgi:CRP-like cAMP-binding protein|nr:cyclic nucleotide-binding domain-containing protein [Thermoflexaceae bacterium]HMS59794.1 cyclic nucleotide-binding domain-containing protein [Tepidiformaceae bacterium]
MTATMDALAAVPMFRDLPKKSLERIEKFARQRSFQAGDVIFKEGEEGVGFFLVDKGTVSVLRGGTEIAKVSAGGFFGEMALLDNHRRSATVKADTAVDCIALMRSDFLAELRNNPDLAVEMLSVLSARVRELDERLSHS